MSDDSTGFDKTVLVLGASTKRDRYSNKAIVMLKEYNIATLATGRRTGEAHGVVISDSWHRDVEIHTVTIYLSEKNQAAYTDDLLNSRVKRLIFNPGAENPELAMRAKEKGIMVVEACTLVMLRTGQF